MVPCRESTNLMNLMKTKEEIVANWLPRYTKRNLEDFGEYILLTNFNKYVEIFAEKFNVPILGRDANMISASAEGITIINFGMGSPNAAIIMDLLSAIHPKACLFLGKCGGIDKKNKIGDLILPIAAIRGEGTSNDYFPPEVPALPAFMLQRAVSSSIRDYARDYWTGTVYTTNRRIWEHDEDFKGYSEKDPGHGRRYGNSYFIQLRFCQSYSYRSPAAGIRPTDDTGRCKNRQKR